MNNFKGKTLRLAQACMLTSVFAVSSAQAVFIIDHTFCPDGLSMTDVLHYEYIYEPRNMQISLSGSRIWSNGSWTDTPYTTKSHNFEIGSWYSTLFVARFEPVVSQHEFRTNSVSIWGPGTFNMLAYKFESVQIKDLSGGCITRQNYLYS